jgi:hypothetical protein
MHPKEPDQVPKDLVDRDVWNEITWLTDDVSLRTSDQFGTELKAMNELWGSTIEMSQEGGDPWFHVVLDVADNLQAALFNALCGYYKVSGWCLRTAVENVVVGTYLQLTLTEKDAQRWQKGDLEVSFSLACDQLQGHKTLKRMESYLRTSQGYTLFQQRTSRQKPGWVRRIFSELSEFSHARPPYSDAHMWEGSNGPVFIPGSFGRIYSLFMNTAFVLFLMAKLGRAGLEMPSSAKWIFHSRKVQVPDFMKECFKYAFGKIP